jgi:4-hydroxy-tetrahydrodipicolinate synthase
MFDPQKLHGIIPPMVTPLTPDEEVDHPSLRRLVNFLIEEGVHGVWVLGTTGEFASLDARQRAAAIATAVEAAAGRVPVIANISDASTYRAIEHAKAAREAGADAIELLPPYYYVNEQDELLAHFREMRSRVDLPLLAYNIPQNVKVKFTVGTVLKLAQEGAIVGLKDSQNDLDWFRQVLIESRDRGLSLRCFLGTRILIDAGVLIGGAGSIPGIANIAPRACVEVYEAARRGDWAAADVATQKVLAATRIAQVAGGGSATAASFASMKTALKLKGILDSAMVSRPLRPLTESEEAKVADFLPTVGLG